MPPGPTDLKTSETADSAALRAHLHEQLSLAGLLGQPLLAAVSGGPDSMALLALLADLRDAHLVHLRVAHIAHGISPAAATGQACVAALAEARAVPLHLAALELGADAGETKARRARYRALRALRRETASAAIVLAHHADDQAETVLLRLLHGSAPAGLAAMQLRSGVLVRPLLAVPRQALVAECGRRGLAVWHDPANADLRHERSWLRREIVPRLAQRHPDVVTRLHAAALHAATERSAWQSLLAALPELDLREPAKESPSIVAHALSRYDSGLASALLRALAFRTGAMLGPQRAERVQQWLHHAERGGWMPIGGAWRAELVQGRVSFRRVRHGVAGPVCIGDGEAGEVLVDGWRIRWTLVDDADEQSTPVRRDGAVQEFEPGVYRLRAVKPGDRIVPFGGEGRRRVVRCLQDAKISGGRRVGWPVLVMDESVVWVAGICRGTDRLPAPGQRRLRVAVEQC